VSDSMPDAREPEFGVASVKPKSRIKLVVLGIAGLVLVPLILYFVVLVFFAQPVKVAGAAMSPTLNNGDKVFVWRTFSSLKRGDIVVFLYPEDQSKSFIMRIVGLPGETIDANLEGWITINGQPIEEPYLTTVVNQAARSRWSQVRSDFKHINPDCYFVMGDNRDASNDSRSWGTVPRSLIYGKFMARYWAED
jgi:signal peptidase I